MGSWRENVEGKPQTQAPAAPLRTPRLSGRPHGAQIGKARICAGGAAATGGPTRLVQTLNPKPLSN
jgi:hypothetical protein